MRPIRQSSNNKTQQAEQQRQAAKKRHEQALQDPNLLTNVEFEQRHDIHIATKRALTEIMGLKQMTEIQLKTYAEALTGRSVLARSKTGSGKTLAFLIPALERLLVNDQRAYHPGRNVGVLIIAPNRELSQQITAQAKDLLTFHDSNLNALCLYGGTKIQKDVAILTKQLPTILVCTPGRLKDHLETTRIRGRKFRDIIAETGILVLDESDSLLQGFPKEMTSIQSFLPRSEKRQTLLFSATLPRKITSAFQAVLPNDYTLVDCFSDRKNQQISSLQLSTDGLEIKQEYVVLDSMKHYISALMAVVFHFLDQKPKRGSQKIMVFLPTARLVKYFTDLSTFVLETYHKNNFSICQMNSRMTQSARNRASNAFRKARQGVLFTTDISQRGLDYPDISLVIQYGYPTSHEAYIHRLGRTGRAGNRGQGVLVLFPFEAKVISTLRRQRIEPNKKLQILLDELSNKENVTPELETVRKLVGQGNRVWLAASETAYLSLIAYYGARKDTLGLNGQEVLDLAKYFAKEAGLQHEPNLSTKLTNALLKEN